MGCKKRNAVIDIYKGIGIILMLMGHVGFGDISSHIVHAFNMPMFFFVSGFLYDETQKYNFKKYLNRKSKGLLYPYLIFGLMNYIIYVILQCARNEIISVSPIRHMFFVNTTGMVSGSMWFLTALWISSVLFWIVNSTCKKTSVKSLVFVVIVLIGIFIAEYSPFRLPFAMDAGMVGAGIQYIGYVCRKEKSRDIINRLCNLSFAKTCIGILVFSILALCNGEINMRTGVYHNIVLFGMNAIVGSLLAYNLSLHIDSIKNFKITCMDNTIKIIERIGRNSLMYVCMNDIIIAEVKHILKLMCKGEGKLHTLFIHSSTLLISIGIIYVCAHYIPVKKWFNKLKGN